MIQALLNIEGTPAFSLTHTHKTIQFQIYTTLEMLKRFVLDPTFGFILPLDVFFTIKSDIQIQYNTFPI